MREYKFRVWEKHAKRIAEVTSFKWQSGHLYHQICTRAIVNEKMIDEWYTYDFGSNSNGIILMQYTGLKDKNGKEIYEGDMLQAPCKEDKPYKCIYDETRCAFIAVTTLEDGTDWYLGIYDDNYFEVIGNIYEDPELLKEGEE